MDLKSKLDEISDLNSKFAQMNSNEFLRGMKIKNVSLFMNEKYNSPNSSKKDICKKIGVSLPTLNKNLKDLNMNDFVRTRKRKDSAPKPTKAVPKKGGGLPSTETMTGGGLTPEEVLAKTKAAFSMT